LRSDLDHIAAGDEQFALIVAAWPNLTKAARRKMLAIIRGAKGTGQSRSKRCRKPAMSAKVTQPIRRPK
jgi:hypothetical protein